MFSRCVPVLQVRHKVLISDRKRVKTVKQLSQQTMETGVQEDSATKFVTQLRKFDNIGGYSGVSGWLGAWSCGCGFTRS